MNNKNIKNLEHLHLLGFNNYEAIIYSFLQNNKSESGEHLCSTPLEISIDTKIPRASVYMTLESLQRRGLVINRKQKKKSVWLINSIENIKDILQTAQNILTGNNKDSKELLRLKTEENPIKNKNIILHIGYEAVREKIFQIFRQHNDENFYGYMGDKDVISAWDTVFTRGEVDEMNRIIKKNKLICVGVFPKGFANEAFLMYGVEWAKDYGGRTASTAYIDRKYFNNTGQMFAFRDAMYLIDLNDKMIIEIRHSNIQKMILSMYAFMLDHGDRVDINAELRELIEKSK